MIILVVLLLCAEANEDYLAAIIYSPKTTYNSDIQTSFPDTIEVNERLMNFKFVFYEIQAASDVAEWTQICHEKFIFDSSNDSAISKQIATFSMSQQRMHFVFSRKNTFSSPWSFFAYTKYADYGSALWTRMQQFDWIRSTIAASPSDLGYSLYDTLRYQEGYTNSKFIFLSEDPDAVVNAVGREIKTTGAQIQIVAGDALYVNNYVSAAKQKNILREDYAILIAG